ncbi:hypothetical protein LGN17_21410 [Burkholderia sp. AU30280]|uniref:hypothetical protein n=1 Tax=Burkholderia sp. AU30280 TaxID=2879628 RepID=UPI001CF3D93D|nr:hypothetical protein [Burkholderia sp. AU30280]MCA8275047.1 hypothetical protein [Burkholderia sp. AU30280]
MPVNIKQQHEADEIKYRNAAARAPEIAVWARSFIHGIEVPKPNLRKRLAGSSLALALDLHDSMCALAAIGSRSAIHVLARSVVENYARGFWLACVATPHEIDRFVAPKRGGSVERLALTLKPLLKRIHAAKKGEQSRLGIDTENAHVLDSLAHGDLGLMNLRNISGYEVGSSSTTALTYAMLLTGATIAVSCAETFVREILDDEPRSLKVFEDGGILIKKTFA